MPQLVWCCISASATFKLKKHFISIAFLWHPICQSSQHFGLEITYYQMKCTENEWKEKMSSYLQGNTTGFMSSVVTINTDWGKQIAPDCVQNSRPFNLLNRSYYCLQERRWCSLPAIYGNIFLDVCFYFYNYSLGLTCVCVCFLFQKLVQAEVFF